MMRRIYLFDVGEFLIGFVTTSFGQAKMMYLHSDWGSGVAYLDIPPCNISPIRPKGILDGELEPKKGLEMGVYDYLMDMECPICKHEADLYYRNGKMGCRQCLGLEDEELN